MEVRPIEFEFRRKVVTTGLLDGLLRPISTLILAILSGKKKFFCILCEMVVQGPNVFRKTRNYKLLNCIKSW